MRLFTRKDLHKRYPNYITGNGRNLIAAIELPNVITATSLYTAWATPAFSAYRADLRRL